MVAERSMLERFTLFLVDEPTPEQILAFRTTEAESRRILELTEKKDRLDLSAEEEAFMNDYFRTEHIVRMAKSKAYRKVKGFE